jgi:hypothetical protein
MHANLLTITNCNNTNLQSLRSQLFKFFHLAASQSLTKKENKKIILRDKI